MDGSIHLVNSNCVKLERNKMDEQQKKDNKNHHKSRTILVTVISYTGYDKITKRDSTKSIFDSLRMTHEGNDQVKEIKALAMIHKYEAFEMEED